MTNKVRNGLRDKFTQVDNEVLNSSELSLKAKGLYAFICSKPDSWEFSYSGLASQLVEGEKAIRSAVRELVEFEVLLRVSNFNPESNKFEGWDWVINPSNEELVKYTDPMNRKPPSRKLPLQEVPKTGTTGNGDEVSNTDLSNTNISNTNIKKDKFELLEEYRNPFLSSSLNDKWNLFIEMRKELKKKLTNISAKQQISKLKGVPPEVAELMLDRSLENGWQGVFQLNDWELKKITEAKQKESEEERQQRVLKERLELIRTGKVKPNTV